MAFSKYWRGAATGDAGGVMKPYTQKASVLWLGTRQRGKGAISTPNAVLKKMPYASGSDIRRRGTSPPS